MAKYEIDRCRLLLQNVEKIKQSMSEINAELSSDGNIPNSAKKGYSANGCEDELRERIYKRKKKKQAEIFSMSISEKKCNRFNSSRFRPRSPQSEQKPPLRTSLEDMDN